jgi:hypothetical protein
MKNYLILFVVVAAFVAFISSKAKEKGDSIVAINNIRMQQAYAAAGLTMTSSNVIIPSIHEHVDALKLTLPENCPDGLAALANVKQVHQSHVVSSITNNQISALIRKLCL